jgi:four helix bundle suffix protein
MELKLTNVARASLEELRRDYEDFLRQRNLPQWDRNDPRRTDLIARRPNTADAVAEWARDMKKNGPYGLDEQAKPSILSTRSISLDYPEIVANGALALLMAACSLLDRQLASLATQFEKEGGFTERLYKTRQAARKT